MLNVNELANSLKPVVLPGEIMKVFILKEGKEYNQGVAYLDDGTMVVVDNARKMISKTIDIVVTSVLQTTAGKMIFGRYIESGVAAQARRSRRRRRARTTDAAPVRRRLRSLRPERPRRVRIPPFHWWRTVFFLIPAITVYTIVLGAASIVSSLFDRRGHFAHRCARAWSWLILKTTGVAVTVEGLARLTPGTTYIFVSNHQSIYDTPVVFASLPYQLRIIAKESLAQVSRARLAPEARRASVRRSPRSRSRRHSEALARARLRRPVADRRSRKGTRSADGHVARFKAGSFLLAIQAGLPIVPVAIIGTRAVMPKGRLRTEPANVTLVIHDPIQPPAIVEPIGARRQGAGRLACTRSSRRRSNARSRAGLKGRTLKFTLTGIFCRDVRDGDHRGRRTRRAVRRGAAQAAGVDRRTDDARTQRRRVSHASRRSTRWSWRCRRSWPAIRRRI